jgi:hypothetical protein
VATLEPFGDAVLTPNERHVIRLFDSDVEALLPEIACVTETAAALGIHVHDRSWRFGQYRYVGS